MIKHAKSVDIKRLSTIAHEGSASTDHREILPLANKLEINSTSGIPLQKDAPSFISKSSDEVAIEEPLEILICTQENNQAIVSSLGITMRTPGEEEALITGLLFAEGIIDHAIEILRFEYLDQELNQHPINSGNINNRICAHLVSGKKIDHKKFQQYFLTNSSCGVCGKSAIQALRLIREPDINASNASISEKTLLNLPLTLKRHQQQFNKTGGVHAVGLFNTNGKLLHISEDIGRHNAMDKTIGHALKTNINLRDNAIICTTSRASFELLQKCALANINCFLAIGAPSSLAIELAIKHEITLIAFMKNNAFNIYSGSWRVG